MTQDTYKLAVIGIIHSCFKEKFGIPRQPGLATEAKAVLELYSPYNCAESVDGITHSSHVWLQFIFHQSPKAWKPRVRPPRLGGNKRMGVFATRSPVRPNALGLSVVKLDSIDTSDGLRLHLSGVDLLDGTPVVDIKPYVPYVDSVAEAVNDFAPQAPCRLAIRFSDLASRQLIQLENTHTSINVKTLIEQVLEQDPRPSYQQFDESRIYGMKLLDFNLRWCYLMAGAELTIEVLDLQRALN